MKEQTVTIDLDRYENLILQEQSYEILLKVLFGKASLNWDCESLNLSTSEIGSYLKSIYNLDYRQRLETLKKEKEGK